MFFRRQITDDGVNNYPYDQWSTVSRMKGVVCFCGIWSRLFTSGP